MSKVENLKNPIFLLHPKSKVVNYKDNHAYTKYKKNCKNNNNFFLPNKKMARTNIRKFEISEKKKKKSEPAKMTDIKFPS